ncbi:hypothetical protein [Afipia sp. GAS231]|jgi:hypothetical protein|uniref:hypothetical protein n=1 Tax=Afipia sp. GAS231 TaxID=1882747 RepID=UPI00087CF434|nr:hypothetical protein [Afipia sp. GAS231]SDP43699.1 hypothetical protein SAMN05444050_6857 [Afipia sp. GAS231]
MTKSIRVTTKKKRGRPATTGRGTQVGERWHPTELAAIDAWIASSPDKNITRAHAIRRLVALGLRVKTPAQPIGKPGRRLRAQELATKAIEKIIDPAAPPEERAQRRRRLTKGPPEFREDRVDQTKAKGK